MKRRNFIKGAATVASVSLIGNNVIATEHIDTEEITHYVLFWLKKELSEKQIKDFSAFFEQLKAIPVVKTLRYGRPAKTNAREVVDNSFSYNLVATFKNLQDINVYETHPIHLDAIKKYSHLWEKVVVHDSVIG
ncbi:Dabb family protein [Pedobacter namyangjuensis]|uniref:Dabb family protein n=1 Tax=Pedobacter namyangjuensis TaxID=600626 RepID=UPI000DE45486|nr:Dabb family protein [Pedobacter namyangjuensis]